MNDECLAELSGVSKRFGSVVALDGMDLPLRPGELLSILGPNGAGKSTAISLLLGLQQPDSGVARLLGQSPLTLEARRGVGVMMQEVTLSPELRVREQIELVASYYPDPLSPDDAMSMTHTTSLGTRPCGKLSGGQKRQVQFAMAVVGRPRLLFLDEPTVGLDLPSREIMWAMLRELVHAGTSIVLTTHYLEEAESLADRVVVMAILFSAIVMATLVVAALALGHTGFTAGQYAGVSLLAILGSSPFCAVGLFIGTLASTKSAPAFANLAYLPFMHLGGLFYPLPKAVQPLEFISPAFYLDKLALRFIGGPSLDQLAMGATGPSSHVTPFLCVAALSGVTLLLTALSIRRLVRVG